MQTIAVIFGGRSAEHDVSIVTALSSIIKPLELTKNYDVEAVYISKDGSWYWDDKLKDIKLFTSGDIENFVRKTRPAQMQFDGGLTLIKSSGLSRKFTKIDLVFPAMHGTYGEDGSLAGLLEMANVPYVGCGLSGSVLAMDKVLAKEAVSSNGTATSKYEYFHKRDFEGSPEKILEWLEESLSYPLFVKPAHLGSSIGISRVENRQALNNAVEVALHYDDKVIVEQEVQNLIEVTLPIIGNDSLTPALLERPLTSTEDFFDFETKYMQGGKQGGKKGGAKGVQGYSELPVELPKDLYDAAVAAGLAAYRALECQGTARIDLLIDQKTQTVYFNEANPLPGGLYAHNWRASGLSSVELVERLVELALEKFMQKNSTTTSFDTNYLKQF